MGDKDARLYSSAGDASPPQTLHAARGTAPREISTSDYTPPVYTEEKNRKHIGSRHFFELSNTFRPLGSEPFGTESGREEVLN